MGGEVRPEDVQAACDALGIKLRPWQRQWIEAAFSGQRVVWSRGRRGGWTTVQRVAQRIADNQDAALGGAAGGEAGE